MAMTGKGFGRGRRLLGAGEGVITSVVILALVAAVIYASSRPALRQRWDLTEGERYSLGPQTLKVLSELPAPVRVITIFRPEPQIVGTGLAAVQTRAGQYVGNLLSEYEVASGGQLSIETYDPHADQNEVEDVVREHHITRYNVVVLACRDRVRLVYLEDLVTIDRGLADPDNMQPAELRAYHAEGPLTSALLSVTDEEPPRALALTGHGEGPIDDFDVFGFGIVAEALRGQGFEVESAELMAGASVPDDVDVVMLLSPRRPLGQPITDALAAFHERGGGLFLALDPWWSDEPFDRFVAELGVMRERALVTREDALVEASSRRTLLPARRFNRDHVITGPIARQNFFANVSTHGGLRRAPQTPAQRGTPVLLRSDDDVFGDAVGADGLPGNYTFDEGTEVRAPRDLVMAVEAPPGRAVVAGGTAWLTNSFLGAAQGGPGNMDLALNAVNWLADRERAVESRSQDAYESIIKMYEDEASDVRMYVVLFMPLGGALLGLLIWFTRRR
jgi:hypothetical protein